MLNLTLNNNLSIIKQIFGGFMKREEQINNILDNLVKSGSNIEYLEELRKQSLDSTKKDISLEDILNSIALEIKYNTEELTPYDDINLSGFVYLIKLTAQDGWKKTVYLLADMCYRLREVFVEGEESHKCAYGEG